MRCEDYGAILPHSRDGGNHIPHEPPCCGVNSGARFIQKDQWRCAHKGNSNGQFSEVLHKPGCVRLTTRIGNMIRTKPPRFKPTSWYQPLVIAVICGAEVCPKSTSKPLFLYRNRRKTEWNKRIQYLKAPQTHTYKKNTHWCTTENTSHCRNKTPVPLTLSAPTLACRGHKRKNDSFYLSLTKYTAASHWYSHATAVTTDWQTLRMCPGGECAECVVTKCLISNSKLPGHGFGTILKSFALTLQSASI